MFLYRQIYYDRLAHKDGVDAQGPGHDAGPALEMMPSREGDDAEVIIAKHRSGATGNVTLTFHESFTLFTNRVGDHPPDVDDGDLGGTPTAGFDPDTDFGAPPMDDFAHDFDDDLPI